MFLKSLTITGFKSFPDKTVIEFGSGITAIVGPNGSGKSNVSDAIRWALGEQSPRTLRGAKMEDVIFAGTSARKGHGYAEVSLTIENADRFIKLDYDEVTVTRRFYRSGESDFFINQKNVRLKDVHEALMDTGLGRDGYSAIGQGRIDEILSLKSTERRDVFEEAAGITKYKYRRDETQKKLLATSENLEKLCDILDGLSERIPALEKQAGKARQYLLFRDELRRNEINLWLDDLDRAKEISTKISGELNLATYQTEECKRTTERLYSTIEQSSAEQARLNMAGDSLRDALRDDEQEMAELRGSIAATESAISGARKNIAQYIDEREQAQQRSGDIEASVNERRESLRQAGARREEILRQLSEGKRAALELNVSETELLEKLDELKQNEIYTKNLITAHSTSLEHIRAAMAQDVSRRETAEHAAADAKRELAELRTEAQNVSNKLDTALNRRADMENIVNGHKLRLEKRRQRAEAIKTERDTLAHERTAAADRRTLLLDMAKDYEGFAYSVRFVMGESTKKTLKGVRGSVAELIRVSDKHAVAIETALGGAMQNLVTDTDEDAKAAIALLKRKNAGRATFLPINVIRGAELDEHGLLYSQDGFVGLANTLAECDAEYSEIIKSLLGRTVIVTDMDAALKIAREFGRRFRIVTLDGQIINSGGAMTGGSQPRAAGILSRANELERLGARVTELDAMLIEKDAAAKDAGRIATDEEYRMSLAIAEQRDNEDAIIVLKSELEAKNAFTTSLCARADQLKRELDDFGESSDKLRLDETTAADALTALLAQESELNKKAEKLESNMALLKQKSLRLGMENAAHAENIAAHDAKCESMTASLHELERILETSRDAGNGLNARITDAESELSELSERRRTLDAQLISATAQAEGKKTDIARNAADRMDAEARRVSRDKELKERNENLVELEKECQRLATAKENADKEEAQVMNRLWESYELTISEAAAQRTKMESRNEAQQKTAELKDKLRDIGSVNVDAIEEYTDVYGRFSALDEQRVDLENSREKLESMINGINGEMKKQFAESFQLLNQYFGEIFVEIFGGGSAELLMEDPADILNCGVEIRVKPPGKNLKVLSLLSGGEKAFVAIALYFAILRLRPAPFCVLDEIEAALDDANVDRFAKYLRTLSKKVQFIVITHRRGTMEEADLLYGVTMQEQGVTRLLIMNMRDFKGEIPK